MSEWLNENDITNFLDYLYSSETEGYFELRLINENDIKSKFFSFPLNISEVIEYIDKHIGDYHIYFGVNPRIKKDGTKDSITESIGLWADLDADDYSNGKKEAFEQLKQFDINPNIIIDSGNGYHAYWILDSRISPEKAERMNRQLSYVLGSDSVVDITRVLRLPGTPNIKDEDNWKLAKVNELDFERPSISVLEDILPDLNSLDISRDVEIDLEQEESEIENRKDFYEHISKSKIAERAEQLPEHVNGDRSQNDFWVACQLYKEGFDDIDVYRCFELFAKWNWAAGKKFKDRGKDYLLDCTLPAAKQEADKFDIYLNKIKQTTGEERADYVEKAINEIHTSSPVKKEAKLDKIKNAANGDIGITQLRKQAKQSQSFNPKDLAEDILNDYNFIYTGGEFRIYNNGVFRSGGKRKLHRILQRRLDTEWSMKRRNEVREWLRDYTHVPEDEVGHPGHLINVKNGMYDIRKDELLDHDPSYRSLTQIHVAYNPDAECKRLDQFVDEVFPEETHNLIWEHAGYPLLRDLNLKKFLVLLGKGNNGKSVWLNMIHKCLGDENVAHEGLSDLSNNRYSVRELFGKIANIHADIESLPLKKTGILKQLTGGDPVRAEIKYGDVFTFKNKAKLFFAVNELPHVKDYNDAFFERIHIVRCPNRFEGDEAEVNLLDKLTAEEAKSAWLNKAIEGAKRLLEQKQFSETSKVMKEIKSFKHQSDSVTEFVDYNIEHQKGGFIKRQDLYNVYKRWCDENGRKATSLSTFTKRANLDESRPRLNDGQQVRCFKDVKLRDITQNKFATGSENISIKK